MTEAVYFFDMGDLIKVGYSQNLRDRPMGLIKEGSYLGAMLGGKEVEQTFLNEFVAFRAHGEYFFHDPIIVATINRILTTYGVIGEECVKLTDVDINPGERVARRDAEIRRKCQWIAKVGVIQVASDKRISVKAAMIAFADMIGISHSLVWELKYRPPTAYITAAAAEALYEFAEARPGRKDQFSTGSEEADDVSRLTGGLTDGH